ncbi:MAG: DUF4190 domain-containing protein [Planctomycetes bacterium]|nr:DUF4190 domain-containing protein [Planctomycetota bacterium]
MTAFDTTFGEQSVVEQKTSGLAIASLVCSLICCLPFTTIPGILLGIGAFVSISGNPAKKGKGLAITGIVLGVLFTAGQGIIYPQAYRVIRDTLKLVESGPEDALTAGFAGDYDGMRAAFHGDGANVQDDEIQVFIDQLQNRYGGFVESHLNKAAQTQPTIGQSTFLFPYILTFENATIDAEVEIISMDPVQRNLVNKLGFIKVLDEELGDLEFPKAQGESSDEEDGASDSSSDSDSPGESDTPSESDTGEGQ